MTDEPIEPITRIDPAEFEDYDDVDSDTVQAGPDDYDPSAVVGGDE